MPQHWYYWPKVTTDSGIFVYVIRGAIRCAAIDECVPNCGYAFCFRHIWIPVMQLPWILWTVMNSVNCHEFCECSSQISRLESILLAAMLLLFEYFQMRHELLPLYVKRVFMLCVGTNISRLLWNEHISSSRCTHVVTYHASDEIERRFTPAEHFAARWFMYSANSELSYSYCIWHFIAAMPNHLHAWHC